MQSNIQAALFFPVFDQQHTPIYTSGFPHIFIAGYQHTAHIYHYIEFYACCSRLIAANLMPRRLRPHNSWSGNAISYS
jgi:hypothetical protein